MESLEFLKDCGLLSWKKLSHRMNVFSVLYRVGRVFCGGCWLLVFFSPLKYDLPDKMHLGFEAFIGFQIMVHVGHSC